MDTLQKYTPDILQIVSKHGAQKVRVFGSFSTNTDTTTSDLDLLIKLEKGKNLLDLIAFKQELEEHIERKAPISEMPSLPRQNRCERRPDFSTAYF